MTKFSQKQLKTCLRYPGGKSRAVTKMAQYFPNLRDYTEFREPFLGGGSVAIHVSKMYPHLKITVNDLYEPLANFWSNLQMFGTELYTELKNLKITNCNQDSARCLFLEMKDVINDEEKSNFDRAIAFYIVNKCSFSGLTESSSFSPQASDSNFSLNGIGRLHEYSDLIQNWTITNLSYERMLTDDWDNRGFFTYMDPPYDIKDNLYGRKGSMHKGFDHDQFAEELDKWTSPMLISYNSSQLVKDRFKEWTVGEFAHTYTMRSVGCYNTDQASRKELVLTNYEVRS